MPFKDPDRLKEYQNEYYHRPENHTKKNAATKRRNTERYATDLAFRNSTKLAVKERKHRVRRIMQDQVSVFREHGCSVCSETESCCLVAHHCDPDQKEFALSAVWFNGYSPDRIDRELAKCVCLCENCHRKYHAGLLTQDQRNCCETPSGVISGIETIKPHDTSIC